MKRWLDRHTGDRQSRRSVQSLLARIAELEELAAEQERQIADLRRSSAELEDLCPRIRTLKSLCVSHTGRAAAEEALSPSLIALNLRRLP